MTVWAVPEHVDLLSNAIAVSGQAVYFMEQFTGVDFAEPKMDLVAVPGKGGAMEVSRIPICHFKNPDLLSRILISY